MTLIELKELVEEKINNGYGEYQVVKDTEDGMFDIEDFEDYTKYTKQKILVIY